MTDPNSPSHWDSLASELGVEEPLQEESPKQPVTPAQPPAPVQKAPAQKAPIEKSAPPARRQPAAAAPQTSSWDMLASELGVAPPPRPVDAPTESPTAKPEPTPIAAVPEAPAAEPERRPPAVPAAAEDSPNFFDERFDFEEPYDLLESGEAPAVAPETPEAGTPETSAEPTEKRPRRRRRHRGRGRGGKQTDSHEKAQTEGDDDHPADAAPEAVAEVGEESDRISVAAEAEGVDIDQPRDEAAKSDEHHPKRRRSRRGKKKSRHSKSSPAADVAPDEAETVLESAESDEAESREMEAIEVGVHAEGRIESSEDDEADDSRSTRLGFRGIPTWEEAIGMIVDKNLEARSKRSGGGSRPSRAKRGPPRDNRRGGKRQS